MARHTAGPRRQRCAPSAPPSPRCTASPVSPIRPPTGCAATYSSASGARDANAGAARSPPSAGRWPETAARRALRDGSDLRGVRGCAIILLMNDTLARISDVAALQVADVEEDGAGPGTLTIRASNTESARHGTHPLPRTGHAAGGAPLPGSGRPLRRAAVPPSAPRRPRQQRAAGPKASALSSASAPPRSTGPPVASVGARYASAAPAIARLPVPASPGCSRPAAGVRPPRQGSTSGAKRPLPGRWRGGDIGWAVDPLGIRAIIPAPASASDAFDSDPAASADPSTERRTRPAQQQPV